MFDSALSATRCHVSVYVCKSLYAPFLGTCPGQLVLLALYYLWLLVKIHGVLKLHTGHGGPVLMV